MTTSSLLSLKMMTSKQNRTAKPPTHMTESHPKTCDRTSIKELDMDISGLKQKMAGPARYWLVGAAAGP
jgi:hypothetical protein